MLLQTRAPVSEENGEIHTRIVPYIFGRIQKAGQALKPSESPSRERERPKPQLYEDAQLTTTQLKPVE